MKPNASINFSSTSRVKAKVDIYNGTTLAHTCTCSDVLQDFTIDRAGEGKFFGFGICQKLKVNLIDLERQLNITKDNNIKIGYIEGDITDNLVHPKFYVSEVDRDEDTNTLSITAFDALKKAADYKLSDVQGWDEDTNLRFLLIRIAHFLGFNAPNFINLSDDVAFFTDEIVITDFFTGDETIRDIFDDMAEMTQSLYFINFNNSLMFKRLVPSHYPTVFTISRDDYFTLHTQTARKLTGICTATELGDNVEELMEETGEDGVIQYIRDNIFLAEREDIDVFLSAALAKIGGREATQFDCEWAGNPLVEPCDWITLVCEDGTTVKSYVMSDTITYDGTLGQYSEWAYEDNDGETYANPSNLGEKLNDTYARVDKANKEIKIVAAESTANKNDISVIRQDVHSINLSVSSLTETTNKKIEGMEDAVAAVQEQTAQFKLEADNALLEFKTTIEENGVSKVDTGMGFKFSSEGLDISKENSEISTKITEDGMTITKSGEEVLVADNQGVRAEDLHATTYLIIGDNSRLEDWGSRTACFWLGG